MPRADALLVWGGDPLFLSDWMHRSGLAGLLATLRPEAVYVGVSAGSIAAAETFAETYGELPRGHDEQAAQRVAFSTVDGELTRLVVTGHGAGLVDFAVIPHLDHPDPPDASLDNARERAARIPAATYAIDDDSAIRVVDGVAEVVSEGRWELFPA